MPFVEPVAHEEEAYFPVRPALQLAEGVEKIGETLLFPQASDVEVRDTA